MLYNTINQSYQSQNNYTGSGIADYYINRYTNMIKNPFTPTYNTINQNYQPQYYQQNTQPQLNYMGGGIS